MAAEIWSVVVDGVTYTWPQVVFKISTGAWPLSQAVRATGFGAKALQSSRCMSPVLPSA